MRRLFRVIRHRFRALARKQELDSQLEQEFAFHLEQLIRENLAKGMTPEEAERAARRAVGNIAVFQEECRDQRRVGWLHDFWQDIRYGIRMLRVNRGFTIVTAASLAIGIGGSTAILSVIDRLVQGSLPYKASEQLVMIRTYPLNMPAALSNASLNDYFAWKEQSGSFESMGTSLANHAVLGQTGDVLQPEYLAGRTVTIELFRLLGVQPLLGRLFIESDYNLGRRSAVVLISYGLWQRRYGGDPSIINKEIMIANAPMTVVGVMPQYFPYAPEIVDYYLPMPLGRRNQATARYFSVTARLKEGVTIAQAQADMEAIAARLAVEFPNRNRGWGVRVQPLREYLFGWMAAPLITLVVAAGFVLIIACANVAGLLLARGAARAPEIAMRVALGAGRGRIVRQLLTESVLLALIGGALGLFVAQWGLSGISSLTPPPGAPRLPAMNITLRTLAFSGVTSIITGLAFGLIPACAPFRSHLNGNRFRETLIAVQVAAAFVLLIGTGLMLKSFVLLSGRDFNFDPKGLFVFDFRIPSQRYMRDIGVYRDARLFELTSNPGLTLQRVYERLQQLPDTISVAGISRPPVNSLVLPTANVVTEEAEEAATTYFLVTPNLFKTLRTPLRRGRDFNDRDNASSTFVAIVNETAASRFWPGRDPIGRRFTLDRGPDESPFEVIGVVPDIPTRTNVTTPQPIIYLSYLQQPARVGPFGNMLGQMSFVLRTPADPMSLLPAAREAVAEIDSERPLANAGTIDGYMGPRMADFRLYVLVLGSFALVATVLAAIGVYGTVTYSVAQRTREIAIRVALGAGTQQIGRLMGRRALLLILMGLAAGLAGSLALTRLLASQLWGVTSSDPLTFGVVSLLLSLVAVVAGSIPVRRALQVNPAVTLRGE